jgi:hypothetical protein
MLKRGRPALPKGCVSDLTFDGLRTGELSSAAAQEIAEHLARCERCRERKLALDRACAQIEAQLPMFAPHPPVREEAPAPIRVRGWRMRGRGAALSALALAVCALLGLLPWVARERSHERETRSKGGPGLSFYVKRGEEVFLWTPGDAVTAGDALRFVVTPQGYGQIAILSRRKDGETSLYYPQGERSAAIDAGTSSIALDGAFELDDTIRDERLFAVFCREPFDTAALQSQLAERGALAAAPPGCAVATLRLPKRHKP